VARWGVVTRKKLVWVIAGLLVVALPLVAAAQRGGGGGGGFGRFFGGGRNAVLPNAEYDGRFILARVRYTSGRSWSADYPDMERNLMEMLQEITSVPVNVEEPNVFTLDDPELMKYPVIYLTEPGYWMPSPEEAQGLRQFSDKGGFVIFDDFHVPREWAQFEYGLRQVWPEAKIVPLDVTHPIFKSFFEIESLEVPDTDIDQTAEFYGVYQDNDPSKRLISVINYMNDLGDYVEHAQSGRAYQFEPTNEAYKFMINYVIYGLSR
jgi:hypothetical protein